MQFLNRLFKLDLRNIVKHILGLIYYIMQIELAKMHDGRNIYVQEKVCCV